MRSAYDTLPSSVYLTACNAPFVEESRSSHLKYHLDPAAWVIPGELNAMKNCARSNGGLATMSDEVSVRFIGLFSPFDHT